MPGLHVVLLTYGFCGSSPPKSTHDPWQYGSVCFLALLVVVSSLRELCCYFLYYNKNMEAYRGPCTEDSSVARGLSTSTSTCGSVLISLDVGLGALLL